MASWLLLLFDFDVLDVLDSNRAFRAFQLPPRPTPPLLLIPQSPCECHMFSVQASLHHLTVPSTLPPCGFPEPAHLTNSCVDMLLGPALGPHSLLKTGVIMHIKLVPVHGSQAFAVGDPLLTI